MHTKALFTSFTIINNKNVFTYHIDGIHWSNAVDKHVCVDHCWLDCNEEQEKTF